LYVCVHYNYIMYLCRRRCIIIRRSWLLFFCRDYHNIAQCESDAPATASLSGHWAQTDEIIIRYAVTRLTSKDFSLSGRYIIHLYICIILCNTMTSFIYLKRPKFVPTSVYWMPLWYVMDDKCIFCLKKIG